MPFAGRPVHPEDGPAAPLGGPAASPCVAAPGATGGSDGSVGWSGGCPACRILSLLCALCAREGADGAASEAWAAGGVKGRLYSFSPLSLHHYSPSSLLLPPFHTLFSSIGALLEASFLSRSAARGRGTKGLHWRSHPHVHLLHLHVFVLEFQVFLISS